MVIQTIILKEKSITVNQFVPSPKMQIEVNRLNKMPTSPNQNNLQCELQLKISILDENEVTLATLQLAYIVISTLNKDDKYSQNEYADRIFNSLQSMFLASSNELLRETPFPPLPLNIKC